MSPSYESITFHTTDHDQDFGLGAFRGLSREPPPDTDLGFNSDEAAARFYLDQIMRDSASPRMRSLRSPDRRERVPDLQVVSETTTPIQTRLVSFEQTHHSIPVFGSRATVELSETRVLVGADASLQYVQNVKPIPSLSQSEALSKIAAFTATAIDEAEMEPPELQFFQDDREEDRPVSWHLVWLFRDVPAVPTEIAQRDPQRFDGHGLAPSMRALNPGYDYLVDAHTGRIVYLYSSTPTVAVPTKAWGLDEADRQQEMWGSKVDGGFVMVDPLHNLMTYDLELHDVDEGDLPPEPITSTDANFDRQHRGAVTAYINAKRVQDFYKTVMGRDGIDDKGMDLVSVVNCTSTPSWSDHSDEWRNAVWWRQTMWYGQTLDRGRLVSLARFLDVIAHELTHGVTEKSSQLVYRDQSGALNESFSDIFGIIIKNWWEAPTRDDVDTWDWELGPGLGQDGPLRDLSDPTRTGKPDHMDAYDPDPERRDHGGVHTNSNIHNKAAYLMLTAQGADGARVFSVMDAAVLFYLTLIRLAPTADFSKAKAMMVNVAKTMYSGDQQMRERNIAVIQGAYEHVGI